jgi:hypothetical protein
MKMPSNTPPEDEPKELWRHFSDTYFSLRVGLAALAFAFPLVLYAYGKLRHGLDLQPSMSAYFWAASADQCAAFPMRTIFVGFLCAIGVGLYAYKGLTPLENLLLNGAGLCAALVAIFPERIGPEEAASDPRLARLFKDCPAVEAWAHQPALPIHYPAAVLLFVLLAIVAWFCAYKSLKYLPAGVDAVRYRRLYRSIALAMLVFPLPGAALAYLLGLKASWVFFVEAAGVVTFGMYWTVKSREMALSRLERAPDEAVHHARQRGLAGGPPAAGPGATSPGARVESLPG